MLTTLLLAAVLSATPEKQAITVLYSTSSAIKGTGVRIHRDAFLTAAHVVDKPGNPVVFRCDSKTPILGVVAKADRQLDLAVVIFSGEKADCSTPITLPAPENAETGSRLFTVGHPNGRLLAVTSGTVSGYEPIATEAGVRYSIISDAQIFPGCSGGPLLNENMQLIGVITGRMCFQEEERVPMCLTAGVPLSLIAEFLKAKQEDDIPAP